MMMMRRRLIVVVQSSFMNDTAHITTSRYNRTFSSSSSSSSSSTTTTTTPHKTSTNKSDYDHRNQIYYPSHCDVAIVGGGLVGCAFARALRQRFKHLSICVLDGNPNAFERKKKRTKKQQKQQQKEGEEEELLLETEYAPKARVSALTPESIDFLEQQCGGVWTEIEKTNLGKEFDAVQAWDAIGEAYVRFEAKEANRATLGVVVENDATHNALCEKLIDEYMETAKSSPENVRNLFLLPGTTVVGTETTESSPFRTVKYTSTNNGIIDGVMNDDNDDDQNENENENKNKVRTISARLVVGADGPNGAMKRFAGLRSFGYDYNQKAVCGTVELDGPTKTAFQRFLKNGPIALLPIGNGKINNEEKYNNNSKRINDDDNDFPNYANIVWTNTPKEAERIAALSDDEFASEVNDAIQGGNEYNYALRKKQIRDSKIVNEGNFARTFSMFLAESFGKQMYAFALDTLTKNNKIENAFTRFLETTLRENEFESPPNVIATAKGSERGAFPLRLKIAGSKTHRRMILIGDAAHVVHPLGGQGVNLGFKDVAAALDAVEKAVAVGDDIGSENTLRNYKNAHFLETTAMVIGLDALQKIFGPKLSSSELFCDLRSIGLRAVNVLSPVRERITKFAAGVTR